MTAGDRSHSPALSDESYLPACAARAAEQASCRPKIGVFDAAAFAGTLPADVNNWVGMADSGRSDGSELPIKYALDYGRPELEEGSHLAELPWGL